MSLYDDIEVPPLKRRLEERPPPVFQAPAKVTAEPEPEVVAVQPTSVATKINMSFLKTQLEAKKALMQSSQTRTLSSVAPAPVVDLSGSSQKPAQKRSLLNLKARKVVAPLPLDSSGAFSIVPKAAKEDKVFLFGEITIEDEYNPTAPTDYASYKQKREMQLAKEKAAKEIADRLHQQHVEEEAKRKAGAAIAPPQALMEQDERDSPPVPEPKFEMPKQFPSATRGLGVAAKIMSNMGYREGSGLGRDEQGMSTALRVEKTGRTALIIGEQNRWKQEPADETKKDESAQSNYNLLKDSSKIVLLRNMVGPSEVDAELEAETREEMSKYGQVGRVVVHSMPNAPEEEAVRIFVEYTNVAQAIKAVVALNGRYFAGRSIRAGFYPLETFSNQEYDHS